MNNCVNLCDSFVQRDDQIHPMKIFYKFALTVLVLCGTLLLKAQSLPSLNSYTSAGAVIYLDFDGQSVSGTSWNVNGDFTCNSSGLNTTQITEVFNRVSEDFRPFNVNVTTSETKFNQAPANKRIRIIITTSHQWYGTGAGGVAFINSFVWGDNTPAFVFTALFNYSVKNISESASHEAGHTLGLKHQSAYDKNCGKISDYNWGQGSGEIGWAPIMGAGYNQNLTLWHNGPNSTGCNSLQSDLSVISNSTNDFGYRTDDHTDTYSSATNLIFSNNKFNISGVVERNDDKDLFKFSMPDYGRFQLNAIPYNVGTGNAGSDLDLQVEFLDANYNLLGTYNPGILLSSIVDTFLNAGVFYIRVEGKGNIYAPDYASLGSYSMLGTYSKETTTLLKSIELNGKPDKDFHYLNWVITTNKTISRQVIEVSNDGRSFYTLNVPETNKRVYQYRPGENKPLKYRIHVTLSDNKEYYSNLITIHQTASPKPQLIGNIISGTNISVSSPDNFQYQILDQNGRMAVRGSVPTGHSKINTGNVAKGVYIIRFSNDIAVWTEKFVKN